MSCSPSQPPVTADDSSDYGSDFTPEQESLVDELLAKVAATENAPATAAAVAPAAAVGDSTRQTPTGDIEDYYAPSQSSPRVPRVLGREKPGATYQLFKTAAAALSPRPVVGGSGQRPGDAGAALG